MGFRGEWLGTARVRIALVAALVAAGLVPVLDRNASWVGSWKMALDQGTFSITTLGPVAAGIACTVYVRFRRSQVPELLSQARRPWVGWIAPAAGVWVLASGAVLLICAFTTTAAWAAGANTFPEVWWVVPPALAVLAAQVAIGALIGSQVGHYWAAPWAAAATFTLYVLTSVGVIPAVFRTGGVTGSLSGETFHAPVFVLQAAAALGIAMGALALSYWDLFRMSSLAYRAATALVVSLAVVALFQLEGSHERYKLSSAVEYECREGHPTVCMTVETTRPLDDLAKKMGQLAPHLDAAGVRVPERFEQKLPGGSDLDNGSIRLYSDEELADHASFEAAARSLAQPADCPAYSSDSPHAFPEVIFTIDRILTLWILVQDGQEPAPSGDDALTAWWAMPPEEQWPWIRETYDALADCRLHDLRLPRSSPASR